MPQAVLSALRSAWDEVAKEEGGSDYFSRTVLQDIAKFGEAAQSKSPAPAQGSGAAVEPNPSP
jgi:hypothetical protein